MPGCPLCGCDNLLPNPNWDLYYCEVCDWSYTGLEVLERRVSVRAYCDGPKPPAQGGK